MPTAREICTKQLYRAIDQLEYVQVDEEQIAPFLPEVYRKLDWLDKEEIIKRFVSMEFGRFLDYYAHAPEIKEPQSAAESKKKSSRSNAKATHNRERAEEGFVRFFFGAGKHDKFYAKEIIGLLNRYTFEPVEVGRIDLKNNFAFFEVREKDAELVEGALHNAKDRNGRHIVVERTNDARPEERHAAKGKAPGKRKKSFDQKSAKEKAQPIVEKKSGRKKKNDWMQFFDSNSKYFSSRDDAAGFAEDGRIKRKKKR